MDIFRGSLSYLILWDLTVAALSMRILIASLLLLSCSHSALAQSLIYANGRILDLVPVTPSFVTEDAQCLALSEETNEILTQLNEAHDDCLKQHNSASSEPGNSCTHAECQDLHTARSSYITRRNVAINSCRAELAKYKQDRLKNSASYRVYDQARESVKSKIIDSAKEQVDKLIPEKYYGAHNATLNATQVNAIKKQCQPLKTPEERQDCYNSVADWAQGRLDQLHATSKNEIGNKIRNESFNKINEHNLKMLENTGNTSKDIQSFGSGEANDSWESDDHW